MKRLDGWEPAVVVEHVYDEQGRLVRSVHRREPEWDEQQQAHVLALLAYRAAKCPGCGGHMPHTTDAEAEDGFVSEAITCHACVSRDIAAKQYADDPHPSALLLSTRRR